MVIFFEAHGTFFGKDCLNCFHLVLRNSLAFFFRKVLSAFFGLRTECFGFLTKNFQPGCQNCNLFVRKDVLSLFWLKNFEFRKSSFTGFSDSRVSIRAVETEFYVSRGLIREKQHFERKAVLMKFFGLGAKNFWPMFLGSALKVGIIVSGGSNP